jgi:16S rRNA (adenine1518-N6/adenine1519-N6)-dimethyltransferase
MAEELFDVVDEHDRVIRQAPRSAVHARQWLHRAVHVFVFNSAGELLIQKRSRLKDEYPGRYTSSASGHLSAGETYEAAAVRELAEELSLCRPLEFLHKFPAGPETSYEHAVLYRTVTDDPVQCDPDEITGVEYHSLEELADWVARRPEDFAPCFVTLFTWYQQSRAVHPAELTAG